MKQMVAVTVLVVVLAAASVSEAATAKRTTYIDPTVVSQLPSHLQRMVEREGDPDVFFVRENDNVRDNVDSPHHVRFAERRAKAVHEAVTPVVSKKEQQQVEAAVPDRKESVPSTARDKARRRRDFEAWQLRLDDLQLEAENRRHAAAEMRFSEVRDKAAAPVSAAPASAAPAQQEMQDEFDDLDEEVTPAQAELEAMQKQKHDADVAREAEKAQEVERASQMRFAEARTHTASKVGAYPRPAAGHGTYDLAGHVLAARLYRAESRKSKRLAAAGDKMMGLQNGKAVDVSLLELSYDELTAAAVHRSDMRPERR